MKELEQISYSYDEWTNIGVDNLDFIMKLIEKYKNRINVVTSNKGWYIQDYDIILINYCFLF